MILPKWEMTLQESPASLGLQGPGETMMRSGFRSAICSSEIWSLRSTRISMDGSISPIRCTRLNVKES